MQERERELLDNRSSVTRSRSPDLSLPLVVNKRGRSQTPRRVPKALRFTRTLLLEPMFMAPPFTFRSLIPEQIVVSIVKAVYECSDVL